MSPHKAPRVTLVSIGLALVLFTVGEAHAQLVMSTFDSDDEGWTSVEFDPGSLCGAIEGGPNPVVFFPSGASPGGYVAESGETAFYTLFNAPPQFLGDASWAYGGEIVLLRACGNTDAMLRASPGSVKATPMWLIPLLSREQYGHNQRQLAYAGTAVNLCHCCTDLRASSRGRAG